MGQITGIPTKNPGDSFLASEVNEIVTQHNATDAQVSTNVVNIDAVEARADVLEAGANNVITQLSDFPTPVSGVITLLGEVYEIRGAVDIGTNRIVMSANTTIRGKSPALDYITSSTTGALITATTNFRVFELGLTAPNGTIFDLNGTGAEVCLMFGVRFFGGGSLGNVDDYDLFEISTGLIVGYSDGFTFGGSNNSLILNDVSFVDTVGVTTIDFNVATFNNVKINNCDFDIATTGVGLAIGASGVNINSGGIGIITGTSFLLNGTAVSTTGYSALDLEWVVAPNNSNIIVSDRLLPQGYADYHDAATTPATQVFNTTPSKLQIDGAGAATYTDKLPRAIRGVSDLWDTVNDKITPISDGDGYDLRVIVQVTGKTSSPTVLTLQFDIGGSATPTNVIVTDDKSVTKAPPYSLVYTFPIYDRTTFFNNGGQLFFSTDVGSLTVSTRSVLISRTSSGAS